MSDSQIYGTVPKDSPSRIRDLRLRLELTQSKFAEALGVSFTTVNRWENAQNEPSPRLWKRIAAAEVHGFDSADMKDESSGTIAESASPYGAASSSLPMETDFASNPEHVRVLGEAERLGFGHLYNPAFATEISLIDPLPHQRIAVYEHMLLQSRLRFLLADDAGAGKTIMTGLYVREMLARRLVRRVLVVPPAGLVGNWKREMSTLFRLPFEIVSGGDARAGNPFLGPESDLLIVSVDTLAGKTMFARLQEPDVVPYDLVVFDEAHKLSARRDPDGTFRATDRYRLAEALAGIEADDARWRLNWAAHHLLLLTATPHMGKDYPYYCLWRLLEPEVLSTQRAFEAFPPEARKAHFIRRVKEEMVRFDGSRIYPERVSDTFSFELTQGEVSEQSLYDETTAYIETVYNRARILNRTAAFLAMSVFQRRLASSTWALLRSFERRLEKLDKLVEDIRAGRITLEQLDNLQRRLDAEARDVLDEKTGDEEDPEGGSEESELEEQRTLGGVIATSLAELEAERLKVRELLDLARRVYERGDESKFEKLRELLQDPKYKGEKVLIFTEHRDTLSFLVRRLEGLGYAGQVAQIHGGMDYRERDAQVELFRKPADQGGCTFLIGTDAAGEGINLQFCWLMVNYDIPWNPARLEQRMGRVHRYNQKHDPVLVLNLVAGKTREGRVLKTLLDKLEKIRRELGSDKVFDQVGRLFQDVSLSHYLQMATSEAGVKDAVRTVEGTLTKEQVAALAERERLLYGDGGDVLKDLPRLTLDLEKETYRRLLPGYIRRFVEKAAPLLDLGVEGDLGELFSLTPLKPRALDPLVPALEIYSAEERKHLTIYRPEDRHSAVWIHPGEPFFDRLRACAQSRFEAAALRGATFIDPMAPRPYLFHLALVTVERAADPAIRALASPETLEYRLVGIRQEDDGTLTESPVEHLLLLKGASEPGYYAGKVADALVAARSFAAEKIAGPLAGAKRDALLATLKGREEFVTSGFDHQEAELLTRRAALTEKARGGDSRARFDLGRVRARQTDLFSHRDATLAALRREPELIASGEVRFLAHALVLPSIDSADKKAYDAAIELIAVQVATAYEAARGASVHDVSTAPLARAAGLTDFPGFDLLSKHADGERAIEVKGRALIGDVELSENEWAKACNLRDRYWLYVVYDCASSHPRLLRIQDPFMKLLVTARGGVIVGEREIFAASEATE